MKPLYQNLDQETYDRLNAQVRVGAPARFDDLRRLLRAYEDAIALLDEAMEYNLPGLGEFLYDDNGEPHVEIDQ